MITHLDYIRYQNEWEYAREQTPMIYSAVEHIDAAMWLITGERYAQSLIALCTCIELLLKGELQKYHQNLINGSKSINATEVKAYISYGKTTDMEQVELPDRTINAKEAIRRSAYIPEYEDTLRTWKDQLIELFDLRNTLIHSGSEPNEQGKYAYRITCVAIPFIDSFLQIANDLSLERLFTSGVYRELTVAKGIFAILKQEKFSYKAYPLKTTGYKFLETFANKPESDTDKAHNYRMEVESILIGECESRISYEWADSDYVIEWCEICENTYAFVKVKPYLTPEPGLLPLAFRCPVCGLGIDEDDFYLAMSHLRISNDVVSKFFENDFYEEDYSNLDYKQLIEELKISVIKNPNAS